MKQGVFGGSKMSRLLTTALPAAALTTGLFVSMKLMLDEETVPMASEKQARVLKIDIATKEDPPEIRTREIKRIEPTTAPPPPAKLTMTKADITLEPVRLTGAAPKAVKFNPLDQLALQPVAIDERDAQPIRPPVPDYPIRALDRGLEGLCEVRFDVDAKGKPYNINPVCSHQIFESAAKRAVSKSEFLPRIVRGQAIERRNVVYPLEFKITS